MKFQGSADTYPLSPFEYRAKCLCFSVFIKLPSLPLSHETKTNDESMPKQHTYYKCQVIRNAPHAQYDFLKNAFPIEKRRRRDPPYPRVGESSAGAA